MNSYFLIAILIISTASVIACVRAKQSLNYKIPTEFENQAYIWMGWVETGFLGEPPF